MPTNEPSEWVSLPNAAKILGVGVVTVRGLVADRKLTVRRIGRSCPRVPRAELLTYAAACTTHAIPAG